MKISVPLRSLFRAGFHRLGGSEVGIRDAVWANGVGGATGGDDAAPASRMSRAGCAEFLNARD